MAVYILATLLFLVFAISGWRVLFPKPFAGIPYNKESARNVMGDLLNLLSAIKDTGGFANAILTISTRNLRVPIAQVLFPVFRSPLIVIDDPREVEDILWRRQKDFGPSKTSLDVLSSVFPRGWFTQYTTPQFKSSKRLYANALRIEFLHKTVAPIVYESTYDLIHLWRLKETTALEARCFMVGDDIENLTLDIIWAAIVGDKPGITKTRLKDLQDQHAYERKILDNRKLFLTEEMTYVRDAIIRHSSSPFPKWVQDLDRYSPRYRKFRATMSGEISRLMKQHFHRSQSFGALQVDGDYPDTCVMEILFRCQARENERATDPICSSEQFDNIFMLLIAGHDSTAVTLMWFVKFMAAYQVAQRELRAALSAAFPCGPKTADDILKVEVPYLDATCEETFRLSGTSKANLRQALVDTEVLGCKVPKGAEVLLNFHIEQTPFPINETQRSRTCQEAAVRSGDGCKDEAGQDLGVFDPSRWLTGDGKPGGASFNPMALPRLGFGGSFRECLGKQLLSELNGSKMHHWSLTTFGQ
ncbi:hypothetical protein NUW58_g8898 [Xylaria curta]|uniref:Uncharacterized protein n=1 Tax=Xylaria curta TaxID=42375 RepID=A0ACC1N4P6_9PEZI|nr:hypothetical protein NUW58_g8898 [Xylaria curta]